MFDFLTLAPEAQERDLEQGLIDHVQRFLMELGVGFAFVGRQVHFEVADEDFYVDLLLYHLKLRCFVVIDLKVVAFRPEFAGKMNFYLSAVDSQMRHADDRPSIGLLLCKERNGLVVEYALRDVRKPIGVAQWETRIVESLPKNLLASCRPLRNSRPSSTRRVASDRRRRRLPVRRARARPLMARMALTTDISSGRFSFKE